jgi:hypothetical protein
MKRLDPRSVIIGFLIAVIGFMSMGATNNTFDSITVGEIILKNTALKIKDSKQNDILMIAGDDFTNAMFLYNKAGKDVAVIGENDNGGGLMSLCNNAGQETIALTQTTGNNGSISLYDNTGQKTIALTHTTGNIGSIGINNKHENNIVYLSATGEDDGHIILSDRYGEGQWVVTGKRK